MLELRTLPKTRTFSPSLPKIRAPIAVRNKEDSDSGLEVKVRSGSNPTGAGSYPSDYNAARSSGMSP